MEKFLAYIVSTSVCFNLLGQSGELDSLKAALTAKTSIDRQYVDLVNEMSFQYLLVEPGKAGEWISRGAFLADSINYPAGSMRALINKGSGFWTVGLFDRALENYYQALALHPDSIDYIILCNNIGEVFKKKNQLDSAFFYFFKGLNAAKKIPNLFPTLLPANIAEAYLMVKNYDSAAYYYQISHDSALKDQNDRGMSYTLFGLGEIAWHKGELDKAMDYHTRAFQIRKKILDQRGIVQSLLRLSTFYEEEKAHEASLSLLDEAERLSGEINAHDLLSTTYKQISDFYYRQKDYDKSIRYLNRYQALKDSLEKASFHNNVNTIKAALSADLKAAENKLLLEKQQENERALKTQGILLLVILSITLILVIFVNKYFKNLQAAKKNSADLDRLNHEIISKNKKIEEINEQLDQQLVTTNKLLSESEKLSRLGGWDFEPETGRMYWTLEMFRQLGVSTKKKPSLDLIRSLLDRSEYLKILTTARQMIDDQKPRSVKVMLGTNGSVRVLSVKLVPEFRKDKLIRIYGSNHDITDTVHSEKKELAILQTLFQLSQKASLKQVNFKNFVEEVLQESINTLDIDRAGFWSYKNGAIHCEGVVDKSISVPPGNYVLQENDYPVYFQAIRENGIIAAHDARSDPRTSELVRDYLEPNNIFSMMDTRVMLNGELVGIVCFAKIADGITWSYSDQRFAGTVSDLISNAFSASQNIILEREKGNLINKLLKKNQNLREFAYVISHNLKDPVTQIIGLSSIHGKPAGEHLSEEIIPRIRNSANNLDKVIKDLTMILKQQEDSTEPVREISLMESFELAKASLESKVLDANPVFRVYFDHTLFIAIQPSVLYNILYNLLSNALKYRRSNVTLEVEIGASRTSEHTVIEFSDNGQGLDMEKFGHKVFKMYERFHLDTEGNGLGLYLIKNQIENMGGSISINSAPDKGTTFIIHIPNPPKENTRRLKKSGDNVLETFMG